MKPLRQQNRPVISYVPRVEPAPPEHAVKMDGFRDVWILRGKYVAFVLMGEHFRRSPRLACRKRRSAGLCRCVRKAKLKPERLQK
jgi:cell division activator